MKSQPTRKIFAIVGTIASGKTTVAKYIQSLGYKQYRLSEVIYTEADKRGLDRKSRSDLQDVGDQLRQEGGYSVLADRVIDLINNSSEKKFVVDSIRNHHEVLALKQAFGDELTTISVDSPIRDRYQRVLDRKGQYNENQTFAEFKAVHERDMGEGNAENEQNVKKCMDLADFYIQNTASEAELFLKVDEILELRS